MGLCLSRCDETHHHQAVAHGPAAVSHRTYSFDDNAESLRQFLRLHATVDAKTSSLMASPASSQAIPPSCDLFSLPPHSEPDVPSSFAISPGRTSASSSRITNSSASWSGRFSVDTASKRSSLHSYDFDCKGDVSSRDRRVRQYQLPLPLSANSAHSSPDTTATVSTFLQEVESFVKAPREKESVCPGSRLTRSRRNDEMRSTFFEVASTSSGGESQGSLEASRDSTSLHRLVLSAPRGLHQIVKSLPQGAGKTRAVPVAKSRRRLPRAAGPPTPVRKSAEQFRAMRELEKGEEAARAALVDIDIHVVAMGKKSPTVSRLPPTSPRMRALKALRRRLSRSLDSRESAVVHVDFEQSFPVVARQPFGNNSTATSRVTPSVGTKSAEELELLPVTSMFSCSDIKLKPEVCDRKHDESCSVEPSKLEQPPPQAENQSPVTVVAESCLGECENLEQNVSNAQLATNLELPSLQLPDEDQSTSALVSAESSFREECNRECPETNEPYAETSLFPGVKEFTESASPSPSRCSSPEAGEDWAEVHPTIQDRAQSEVGDSQRFLSKALNSLLKLLLITDGEHTGPDYSTALEQNENHGS